MRPLRLVPLVLLAVLGLAAPARAATVGFADVGLCGKGECSPDLISVVAAPGEANRVRVAVDAQGVLITDAGATLDGACAAVDERTRRCPPGLVTVLLGDGDDVVEGGAVAEGGPGADTITGAGTGRGGEGDDVIVGTTDASGGPGDDRIDLADRLSGTASGDEGDDVLRGGGGDGTFRPGPGRDVVDAGGGADVVVDADPEPGADVLEGGDGRDVLSFFGRSDAVRAELGAQTTSDGDAVAGFEGLAGGAGDDVLLGDAGPNALFGSSGNDVLAGGDGADGLTGGPGFDRFDGGPGDDSVSARQTYRGFDPGNAGFDAGLDARPEPIDCGPGTDRITDLLGDLMAPDCERLPFGQTPSVRFERREVAVAVRCPFDLATRGRCRGQVRVQPAAYADAGPSPSLRRRSFAIGRQRTAIVRVERSLLAAEPLQVTVRFGTTPRTGVAVQWVVPAPAPRP